MKKNKYMMTAFMLYMNYFVHGMGVIIISQNAITLFHHITSKMCSTLVSPTLLRIK